MSRRHQLFGIAFDSQFPLPEVPLATPGIDADVTIRVGVVGAGLPFEPGLHRLGPKDDLLCIDRTARYRCRHGTEIIVEPQDNAPERNVRLFLLGSTMGLLLHQRGLLPLHANTVVVDGVGLAFTGHSGAGKSTLAAWFMDAGYPVIADDVSVIQFDKSSQPVVPPAMPRIRLWRDALELSGRTFAHFERSYLGDDDEWEKYDVPVAHRTEALKPVQLGGIVVLQRGDANSLDRLTGMEAVDAVIANTYRGEFLQGPQIEAHMRTSVAVARAVPVWRWQRQWGHENIGASVERLLQTILPV